MSVVLKPDAGPKRKRYGTYETMYVYDYTKWSFPKGYPSEKKRGWRCPLSRCSRWNADEIERCQGYMSGEPCHSLHPKLKGQRKKSPAFFSLDLREKKVAKKAKKP